MGLVRKVGSGWGASGVGVDTATPMGLAVIESQNASSAPLVWEGTVDCTELCHICESLAGNERVQADAKVPMSTKNTIQQIL